jgi:hypothetical protein
LVTVCTDNNTQDTKRKAKDKETNMKAFSIFLRLALLVLLIGAPFQAPSPAAAAGLAPASPEAGVVAGILPSTIDVGASHSCGVQTDGTLACWGLDDVGQATPPAGIFTQVSAGLSHSCGLQTDGTVTCWGWNLSGEATPPSGTFTQVSAGDLFSCGLRTDRSIACWGRDEYGQSTPPPAPSPGRAGGYHACALKTDGSLACWGWTAVATPPAGTFRSAGLNVHLRPENRWHPGLLGQRHVWPGHAVSRLYPG